MFDPRLASALGLVAEAARNARDRWWVIGSAAMALHGAGPIEVGDIDLLMSRSDAARWLEGEGVAPAPGSRHERFRSDVFGRSELGGYRVEVFGGFHVHHDGGWREVVPDSREPIRIAHRTVFIPSIADLIAMCRLFGRPKDAERVSLLQAVDTRRIVSRPR